MPTRRFGSPRFVVYDLASGETVMSGTGARHLLTFTCEMPSLGVDNRFVEILDCGAEGPDANTIELPLVAARERFATVFRGEGMPDLPPVALATDVDSPPPGRRRSAAVD